MEFKLNINSLFLKISTFRFDGYFCYIVLLFYPPIMILSLNMSIQIIYFLLNQNQL